MLPEYFFYVTLKRKIFWELYGHSIWTWKVHMLMYNISCLFGRIVENSEAVY